MIFFLSDCLSQPVGLSTLERSTARKVFGPRGSLLHYCFTILPPPSSLIPYESSPFVLWRCQRYPTDPAGAGMAMPPTESPKTTQNADTDSYDKPRILSLDDLPAEIIDEIAQHLRSEQKRPDMGECRCLRKHYRDRDRTLQFIDSVEPADAFPDPSAAFSSISKRYRAIVFDGNNKRAVSLGFSTCCVKRVFKIPDSIRASVSYVL